MPELPEVETVKRVLNQWCQNKFIKKVEVLYPNVLMNIEQKQFQKELENQQIIEIQRLGKYLIFILSNGILLSHLRMEGKYFLLSELKELDKHAEVIFSLNDGKYLIYSDTRKFGKMYLKTKNNYLTTAPLSKLGQEPFRITKEDLYQRLKNIKTTVKFALLDQSIIAGIGNIYVDEVLHLAKINPYTISSSITIDQCQMIIDFSKKVLTRAIELGGSTVSSFTFNNHVNGLFQNELNVYGRKGKKCNFCSTIIVKDKMKGRGTHYCPNCQK